MQPKRTGVTKQACMECMEEGKEGPKAEKSFLDSRVF